MCWDSLVDDVRQTLQLFPHSAVVPASGRAQTPCDDSRTAQAQDAWLAPGSTTTDVRNPEDR
jgi:hypothetical protein